MAGRPLEGALGGSLRVRHAVVTVTNPASGETWTFPDVDWLQLHLVSDAGSDRAAIDMTGVAHREPGGSPVTLTMQEVDPDGG